MMSLCVKNNDFVLQLWSVLNQEGNEMKPELQLHITDMSPDPEAIDKTIYGADKIIDFCNAVTKLVEQWKSE